MGWVRYASHKLAQKPYVQRQDKPFLMLCSVLLLPSVITTACQVAVALTPQAEAPPTPPLPRQQPGTPSSPGPESPSLQKLNSLKKKQLGMAGKGRGRGQLSRGGPWWLCPQTKTF